MTDNNQRKPTILTLTLGHVFTDFDSVSAHLEVLGIRREVANILKKTECQHVLEMLEENTIDAIETRNLRYWQENWDRVEPMLSAIETLAQRNNIPMLNTPAMFRWIGNKGGYLTDLALNGIPIIPTIFIGQHDKPILSDHIKGKPHGIVMKPSIAAKAYGLEFIKHYPNDTLYEVMIPQESQAGQRPSVIKLFLDASQLQAHFEEYSKKHRSTELTSKQLILLQDMIVQKVEISCIMIRGMKPYYIKRVEGLHTKVAHEAFGGENQLERYPGNDLEQFAQSVRNAMPDRLRDEAIIRIDILKCPDKLILLEVETGSLRLFNEKELANNSDQYAKVLAQVAKNSYILFRGNTHRKGAVNSNLAPTVLILS